MSWDYQSKPAMLWAAVKRPGQILALWWTNRYWGTRRPLWLLKTILAANEASERWKRYHRGETVRPDLEADCPDFYPD